MPRPPILPVIDWKSIYDSGKDYAAWLKAAENSEHRDRMETIRRNLSLEPPTVGFLHGMARPVHVMAIAEDWCGDVVRHVPVLARLADEAKDLHVRFITRDQHPDVFVRFLTNGGEAIPKFIFLNDHFVECGSWGPMPATHRELIARGKACGDVAAARKRVAALYEADLQCTEVIAELVHLIGVASALAP